MTTQKPVSVAYITSDFPTLTESFIRREVQEVRALGVPLTVYSLRPCPSRLDDPALSCFVKGTAYSPWLFSRGLLAAHLYFLRRQTGRYMSALWLCCRTALRHARHPDMSLKTFVIFPKTVYFARLMAERGVTHVHSHFANHPTTAAMLISVLLGLPFTFTGHAWDIFVTKNHAMLREKIARARVVVTCTQFNRAFLSAFCDDEAEAKIVVRYHGVSLPDTWPHRREPGLILGVGRLARQKGFVHLILACAQLAREGLEFRCVIVGEGPERSSLEVEIQDAGLAGRVALIGARPHKEVMGLLAQAAVLVQPSVRTEDDSMDGIPNVILEAFSLETPVISTQLSGIPEVVREAETGRLVPPGNAAALAEAIRGVLRDPEAHAAFARRGRELVADRFNVQRNVRGFLEAILGDGVEAGEDRLARVAHSPVCLP